MYMAEMNNYREGRWFRPWRQTELIDFELPHVIRDIKGQKTVKMGEAVVKCHDATIASEICEEMWVL